MQPSWRPRGPMAAIRRSHGKRWSQNGPKIVPKAEERRGKRGDVVNVVSFCAVLVCVASLLCLLWLCLYMCVCVCEVFSLLLLVSCAFFFCVCVCMCSVLSFFTGHIIIRFCAAGAPSSLGDCQQALGREVCKGATTRCFSNLIKVLFEHSDLNAAYCQAYGLFWARRINSTAQSAVNWRQKPCLFWNRIIRVFGFTRLHF